MGSMLCEIFLPTRNDPFLCFFLPLRKIFYYPPPCNLFSLHSYTLYKGLIYANLLPSFCIYHILTLVSKELNMINNVVNIKLLILSAFPYGAIIPISPMMKLR